MRINAPSKLCFKYSPLFLAFFMLILTVGTLHAEATSPGSITQINSSEITREDLQSKIDSLAVKQGIEEGLKNKLIKLYEATQDQLDDVQWFQMLDTTFQNSIHQVPKQLQALENGTERLQKQWSQGKAENYSRIPHDELNQRLIMEKGNLSSLSSQIKKLEDDIAAQINRPDQIRQEKVKAKERIESAQEKLKSTHAEVESKLEIEARKLFLNAQISARSAELKALDIEAISNPLRLARMKAELQLLELKRIGLGPVINEIDETLFKMRQQQTEQMQEALSQAQLDLFGRPAVIQKVVRENIQYSKDLTKIAEKTKKYSEKMEVVDEQISVIEKDYKSAEKKISLAGLSPVLGKILREQRRNLGLQMKSYQSLDAVRNETAITGLAQFNVEASSKEIADIDFALQQLMEQVDSTLLSEEKLKIQSELRVLLNSQKELLNQLSNAYLSFLRTLGDYSFAREEMLGRTEKFADYLDERLLWVPSSPPIKMSYLLAIYQSTQWLLSPVNWMGVKRDFSRNLIQHPFLSGSVVIILSILVFSKSWVKRLINGITRKVEKPYTDQFYFTLQSFAFIFILTAPIPLAFYFSGWLLASDLNAGDFSKAVGEGLLSASIPLFFLQFFYYLFSPEGIARKHFLWTEESVRLMRSLISLVRLIAIPAIFLIDMTGAYHVGTHSDSLGRLALIITMIIMSYVLSRLLQPSKGIVMGYVKARPKAWVSRLRYIWYPILIFIPLIVGSYAVAGYYLSALELQQKIIITLRFIFVTIIIHELAVRWLTTINRQLALKNARQKRKAKAAELGKKNRQSVLKNWSLIWTMNYWIFPKSMNRP